MWLWMVTLIYGGMENVMPGNRPRPMTLPDGRKVLVVEVDFEIIQEDWNEYRLNDGGKLRLKTNLVRVFRIVDEQGQPVHDANGDTEYFVQTGMLIVPRDVE
jgi:hypothetical protein